MLLFSSALILLRKGRLGQILEWESTFSSEVGNQLGGRLLALTRAVAREREESQKLLLEARLEGPSLTCAASDGTNGTSVLGCIEADVRNQIFSLQHFSRSIRFAHF